MNGTFLHPAKRVSSDELLEPDPPRCESCGSRMWLTKVETKVSSEGIRACKSFECNLRRRSMAIRAAD